MASKPIDLRLKHHKKESLRRQFIVQGEYWEYLGKTTAKGVTPLQQTRLGNIIHINHSSNKQKKIASSVNRTRASSMATMNSTTRPMMLDQPARYRTNCLAYFPLFNYMTWNKAETYTTYSWDCIYARESQNPTIKYAAFVPWSTSLCFLNLIYSCVYYFDVYANVHLYSSYQVDRMIGFNHSRLL